MTLLTPPGFLQAGTYSALLDRMYGVTIDSVRNFSLLHGARQGFYANRFPTYSNPSGMQVAVTACAGIIANNFTTDGGDYKFANPTSFTVTLAGSSPTLNRKDIVGIQVKDNFYDSSGLNQVIAAVLQGAGSAGTPSDPAIPNGFIPVVRAVVNANAVNPTLQDLRIYTTNDGGILPVANAAERDALGTPPVGFTVWRIDRSWAERYTGSSWAVQNTAVTSSAADRDAAITAAYNGQLAYSSDTGKMWQRHSGAWREFPNPCRVHLRQTVAQGLSGAFVDITFTTEDRDTHNAHDTGVNTARFTAPFNGDFLFMGASASVAGAGFRASRWAKNGAAIAGSQLDTTTQAGADWPIPARSIIVPLVTGDFVTLQVFSDTNLNTSVFNDTQSTMSVVQVGSVGTS